MNTLWQAYQSLSVLKDSMLPKFSAEVANVVRLSIMQRDNAEQERNQAMIIVGEQKAALIKAEWNATQARVTAEQARATAMEEALAACAEMRRQADPSVRNHYDACTAAIRAAISAQATK